MIKVRRIESVEDILVSHGGEVFAITWDKFLNEFKVERLKPVAHGASRPGVDEEKPKGKPIKPREKGAHVKATDTPIVERTPTLAIRQGPLDDILKLEDVNKDTVRPILRMWYRFAAKSSLEDYVYSYMRFLRKTNYIDGEGHVLKKLGEQNEDEDEEEEKKPTIPAPETLTVVTTRDDTVIYLEPLNEILQLNIVNDAALGQVLSRYYEAPRPSAMYVIKRSWKRFLETCNYLDKTGKPTIEKVTLQKVTVQSSEGGDKS